MVLITLFRKVNEMAYKIMELRNNDVAKMYKDNIPIEQIAKKHKINKESVRRILAKKGLIEIKRKPYKKKKKAQRKYLNCGFDVDRSINISFNIKSGSYEIRRYLYGIRESKYFSSFHNIEEVKEYCDEMDLLNWDYDKRFEVRDKILAKSSMNVLTHRSDESA